MSAVAIARTDVKARLRRIDSEFFASPLRLATEAMLKDPTKWLSITEISGPPTSGATPKGHDLANGEVPFVTIDGIDPLWLDGTRSKRVTAAQRDGELKRVLLRRGDVVVTIKRRICNAAVVSGDVAGSVVNQDVALLRPTGVMEPEVIAAVLASRVGQRQATLLQTEQINPYLSVTSLKELRFPKLDASVRRAIVAVVRERAAQLEHAESEIRSATGIVATACGVALESANKAVSRGFKSVRSTGRLDAEFFTQAALSLGVKESTTLADFTVRLANGVTPGAKDYGDVGLPILKVGGLSRFGAVDWLGDRVRANAASARTTRNRVQVGDVLILAAAHDTKYIGKSGVVLSLPAGEPDCRVVGELIVARPSDVEVGATLSAYLNIPVVRRESQRLVRGQSAHLYPSDLGTLPVPVFADDLVERVNQRFEASRSARIRSLECLAEAKDLVDRAVLGTE